MRQTWGRRNKFQCQVSSQENIANEIQVYSAENHQGLKIEATLFRHDALIQLRKLISESKQLQKMYFFTSNHCKRF